MRIRNCFKNAKVNTLGSFNSAAVGGLSLYCDKFTLKLPKSHTLDVRWISSVTKLAGANTEGFSIQVEFYAGLGARTLSGLGSESGDQTRLGGISITDDVLRLLYAWRNLVLMLELDK